MHRTLVLLHRLEASGAASVYLVAWYAAAGLNIWAVWSLALLGSLTRVCMGALRGYQRTDPLRARKVTGHFHTPSARDKFSDTVERRLLASSQQTSHVYSELHTRF
jgi:hypothetical protein